MSESDSEHCELLKGNNIDYAYLSVWIDSLRGLMDTDEYGRQDFWIDSIQVS